MIIKTTNARGPMARIRARRKTITLRLTGLEYTCALAVLAEAWAEGDAYLLADAMRVLTNDA